MLTNHSQEALTKYGKRGAAARRASVGISNDAVRLIRRLAKQGQTGASIARELGVCKPTVYKIIQGKSYVDVPDEPPANDQ